MTQENDNAEDSEIMAFVIFRNEAVYAVVLDETHAAECVKRLNAQRGYFVFYHYRAARVISDTDFE